MTLRLVKDGAPGPDTETVEMIARGTERMADAVKAGGVFWLLTEVEGEISASFFGGKLEASVLAEAIAADMKREAVGP
jgi:hypothetical protein